MSAIIRPALSRKALVFAFLSGLIFLLTLAGASAAAPDTQEPRESTGTPISDGIVQAPGEAAAETPPGASEASPHMAGTAALVRERFPGHTAEQFAPYTKNHAQRREIPGSNNTGEHRFAQLTSPDRAALVALYNATDGPNWTNNSGWLTDTPVGQWYGVATNDSGRVTSLTSG